MVALESLGNRSKFIGRLLCGVAALSSACSASSGQVAVSEASAASSGAFAASPALANARREKAEAEALVPPAVAPNLDREHALALINGPVRSWVQARVQRSESAARAYAPVIRENDAEELTGLLELGALWQTFGDELRRTVVATVPSEFARDPELKRAYLSAVLDATQRPFDEARGALQRCVKRAEETARADAGAACKARLSRLPESTATASDAAGSVVESESESGSKQVAPARPKLSGSQSTPCEFAGSLESDEFELWAESGTRSRVARVWRLDLASLVLPEKEGASARVSALWPLQGTYWLDGASMPLVLRAREELVKGHVWLDAGTPMHVFGPNAGAVEAVRPRSWTAGSEPIFSRRIRCTELVLAGSIEQTFPTVKNALAFKGLLQLSAAPGTPPIAKLQLAKSATFEVLAEKGPWRRIAARAIDWQLPFSFDAWTKDAADGDGGMGLIGLLNEPSPSHVSITALKAFISPSTAMPSVTLAPEVWFQAGKAKSGFVPIKVSGLSGPDRGDLWVQESALARHARPLKAH